MASFSAILNKVCRTALNISKKYTKLPGSASVITSRSFTASKREGRKISMNGANIYCEQVGNGDHTLLLIPGVLGTIQSDYDQLMEKLNRDKFTLVSFDPRGYANSRPPERIFSENVMEQDAEDGAKLMEVLGHQHYSLLGWSYGCGVATFMANKWGDRIRKIILCNGFSYINQEQLKVFKLMRNLDNWYPSLRKLKKEVFGEELTTKLMNDWVDHLQRKEPDANGNLDQYNKELENVACETLVMYGGKDPFVPIVHAEEIHRKIKGSRLVCFEEGKHDLHFRFPDRFIKLVEEFLLEGDQEENLKRAY